MLDRLRQAETEDPEFKLTHYTHHGADNSLKIHVGHQCIPIGRAALMSRCSDANHGHGCPQIRDMHREDPRTYKQSADQHRAFGGTHRQPTAPDQKRGEPAATDAANVCSQINDHERKPDPIQGKPVLRIEELWNPVQIEPPNVDTGHLSGADPGMILQPPVQDPGLSADMPLCMRLQFRTEMFNLALSGARSSGLVAAAKRCLMSSNWFSAPRPFPRSYKTERRAVNRTEGQNLFGKGSKP